MVKKALQLDQIHTPRCTRTHTNTYRLIFKKITPVGGVAYAFNSSHSRWISTFVASLVHIMSSGPAREQTNKTQNTNNKQPQIL